MECPNCNGQLNRLEDEWPGMGNQAMARCPDCGTVALCSGEVVTRYWLDGQEGGDGCHRSDHTLISEPV